MRLLVQDQHVVAMVPPAASPAGTEIPVSMKNWGHATIIISGDNATSVTGATTTLKQGTAVGSVGAMTGDKALAFTRYWLNGDTSANDTLTETTASSTFTSPTTANKNWVAVLEVNAEDLDRANDFDCLRVDVTGNANCVISAVCILSRGRYVGGTPSVSAITD